MIPSHWFSFWSHWFFLLQHLQLPGLAALPSPTRGPETAPTKRSLLAPKRAQLWLLRETAKYRRLRLALEDATTLPKAMPSSCLKQGTDYLESYSSVVRTWSTSIPKWSLPWSICSTSDHNVCATSLLPPNQHTIISPGPISDSDQHADDIPVVCAHPNWVFVIHQPCMQHHRQMLRITS